MAAAGSNACPRTCEYIYIYIGVQADGNPDLAPLVCRPPAPVAALASIHFIIHAWQPPSPCLPTHTDRHARTDKHRHTCIYIFCMCTYMPICIYAYACLHLRLFSYAMVCYELQTHRQTRTYMHTHARKHICGWVHCGGGWVHGGRQYIYIYIT